MTWQRVCIIGVGLLGGSIGMRLRRSTLAKEVVGFGRDRRKLDRAIELKAIDRGEETFELAAHAADLVIACTPVQQIPNSLLEASSFASSQALFTDVGSTKSSIVSALSSTPFSHRFVGSHPIAGSDKIGVEYANANLFENRLVIVTPANGTNRSSTESILDFWKQLGAQTLTMTAVEHDDSMAVTSHLPHVLASMLSLTTPKDRIELTGTGWSDTTRIAAGNPQLWRQILEENHGPVLRAMKNFATISGEWMAAMEAKDFDRVEQLLIAGKEIRDSVGNRHSSG